MQQDGLRSSFLPDRSLNYSAASSFYGRDLNFGRNTQEKTGVRTMPNPQPAIFLANSSDLHEAYEQSVVKRKNTIDDPIQTHLLLQTALGDSSTYEILSLEELDVLKKEANNVAARIDSLKRKLVLEAKVRDAARSLSRLQSTPSSTSSPPRIQRRDSSTEPESQLEAQGAHFQAEKTCDKLQKDLNSLQQRERKIQTRLLQHTAGVLQTTHHGYSELHGRPGQRPESPASFDGNMNTATNGEVNGFDELMLNDNFGFDVFSSTILAKRDVESASLPASREAAKSHQEMISSLSRGLEDLNNRMAAVLAMTNTRKAHKYNQFPNIVNKVGDISFAQQIEHLQQGLQDIEREQSALQKRSVDEGKLTQLQADLQESLQENLTLQQDYDKSRDAMNARLIDINLELHKLLSAAGQNPLGASMDGGPSENLNYTEARIDDLQSLVDSSLATAQKAEQMESVLQGLWSFMLGAEQELQARRRAERERLNSLRSARSKIESEDEIFPEEEEEGLSTEFSTQAFNTRVQWLVSQALHFEEKSSQLRRKVKAQREKVARSIDEGQAKHDDLKAELSRTNELHTNARNELCGVETRSQQIADAHDEKDALIKSLQTQLSQAATEARKAAELELRELEEKYRKAQQKCVLLEKDLATKATERAPDNANCEPEVTGLRLEVARLKTDLTVCQAELEGAYGSRSQKAADLAAAADVEASKKFEELLDVNAQLKDQIADLQAGKTSRTGREGQLERELAETIREFEELTKAAVETEREREELESTVDKYRDKIDELEARIAEDSIKWLGVAGPGAGSGEGYRSPGGGGPGSAGQSMGVAVLKNEFKKMMRETRLESARQIRAEQDERKRLESIIRILKQNGVK